MLDKEMKIDKKEVGRRIFNIRLNMGLTLEQFGKLFDAEKSNVQKWEKGLSLPRRERLETISKLGNMTVNQLLYGGSKQDVEELYQRLIKLPEVDILGIFRRVHNKFKLEGE
jgi:putative DNA-binding phage protein